MTRCIIGNYYTKESIQEALGYLNEEDVKLLLSKLQRKEISFFKDLNRIDVPTFFKDSWPILIDSLLDVTKDDRKRKGDRLIQMRISNYLICSTPIRRYILLQRGSFNKNLFDYYILKYFNLSVNENIE